MIGKIIALHIGLVSSTWALPWLPPVHETQPQNVENNTHGSSVNFSGVWAGACDFKPAADLTIKQEAEKLSISYGFMEEHYVIGEIKSTVSNRLTESEYGTAFVNLDREHQALIFLNSNLFKKTANGLNVFFSKVSLVLNDGTMSVKGQYFQSNEGIGDVTLEEIYCVYRLKK